MKSEITFRHKHPWSSVVYIMMHNIANIANSYAVFGICIKQYFRYSNFVNLRWIQKFPQPIFPNLYNITNIVYSN